MRIYTAESKLLAIVVAFAANEARADLPAVTHGFRGDGPVKLVRVLGDYPRRHAAEINAAAFSADGTRLATAGGDRRIKLWDARTGEELGELSPAKGRTFELVFSPDGKRLAAASSSGTLTVWDVERAAPDQVLSGHASAVLCAAFSPSGRLVATGGRDKTVRVWDARTGTEVARAPVAALRLAFPDEGTVLAATPAGGRARIDAASGAVAADTAPVVDSAQAAFAGERVAFEAGGSLRLGDTTLAVGPATALAISADGGSALVGAADGTFASWDIAAGHRRWQRRAHAAEITALAFSPDGTRLIAASRDTSFSLWDAAGQPALALPLGHQAPVYGVAFATEDRVASAGGDGRLRVWNASTGAEEHAFSLGSGPLFAVVAVGDGTVVVGSDDGRLHAVNVARRHSIGAVHAHTGGVMALAVAGGTLASCGHDGSIKLWALHLRRAHESIAAHAPCAALALLRDRAAAGVGQRALLYDPHGKLVGSLLHDGLVWGAASADERLFTAADDHVVRAWDAAGREQRLWTHAGAAVAVVPCPDASCVASAGADGTVVLGSPSTGPTAKLDLDSASDAPLSLALSPSGRQLAVGTRRGVVLLFRIDP